MRRAARQGEAVAPAEQQRHDIGERIPADREWAQLQEDRVDRGISYGKHQR